MRAMMLFLTGILVAGCGSSSGGGTAMNGEACVTTKDCYFDSDAYSKSPTMVLTCARSGRTCRLASELALGEPCKDNVQCASRNCGYNYRSCTKSCTSNTSCDSSTVCARDPYSPSLYCLPSCKTDDDCAVYRDGNRPEVHCKTTKTPIDDSVNACIP